MKKKKNYMHLVYALYYRIVINNKIKMENRKRGQNHYIIDRIN